MPKKAADFAAESCYRTKAGTVQHRRADCPQLTGREPILTNRREAWQAGAKTICVRCWFN